MKWCPTCKDRGDLARCLIPPTGTGVEVGVRRGEFSEIMLDQLPQGRLFLVDPWVVYPEYVRSDSDGTWDDEVDYRITLNKMARFGVRAQVLRMFSTSASKVIPDELDIVYIDANHSYGYVLNDLWTWWPKIKSGGILAGHDIMYQQCLGVTQAVVEFAFMHMLETYIVPGSTDNVCRDGQVPSWYFRKP